MTHVLKTGFAVRLLAGLTLIAGLTFSAAETFAAPPTPAGKIYYCNGTWSNIFCMNANGSSNAQALPKAALDALNPGWIVPVVPFHQLQSGSQWFITTAQTGVYDTVIDANGNVSTNRPHYDLVAVRKNPSNGTQLDVVQLTDLYGIMNSFVPGFIGLSNNSNEDPLFSYASYNAWDLRGRFVENDDGSTEVDMTGDSVKKIRLPVTGAEIASGAYVPYDDTLTDEELDDLIWPHNKGPVGSLTMVSSLAGDLNVAIYQNRLMIVDAAAPDYDNPIRVLWDGNAGISPNNMSSTQWSPNGLTIAFHADDGNVWTVPVSGATTPKKVLSITSTTKRGVTTTNRYRYPVWSPDSAYLAALREDSTGTTLSGARMVRIPAGGGAITDLGAVTPSSTGVFPTLRWVPNN